MIGFELTEEQRAVQETARRFARAEIAPVAARLDRDEEFPRAICEKAFELGLMNLAIPAELGGPGLSHLEQVIVAEEIAAGCVAVATTLVANDLALLPIVLFGTPDQRRRLLQPFTERLRFAAFCLTEPGAGSDVSGLATRARRDGDDYVLNGTKCCITNGGVADRSPCSPPSTRRSAAAGSPASWSRGGRPASPSRRRRTRWGSAPRTR